jgi:diguanylate cyclase (GGDEF)-like protein
MSMQSFNFLRSGPNLPVGVPIRESWTPEIPADAIGDLASALAALSEAERVIRSQEEHIRKLENMALTDELTGLLNRRGFTAALQRELAFARRDAKAGGILVMVDLDGFKSVNDLWGHGAGDEYLQMVAHTLLTGVRSSDVIARLGGDEFAVLFTRIDENTGLRRLAKLEKSFNGRIVQCAGRTLPLRASFGLSAYGPADAPEAVLATADLKLYAHKARRKNLPFVWG